MASISREPNGRRTVQFVGVDGRRRSIRLGKVPQKTAEAIKTRVELIVAAQLAQHALDADTARWLSRLDATMHVKLAAVGLCEARESATLDQFLANYVADRSDVKETTSTVYGHTKRCLVEFFGADRPLRDITAGEADQWRLWLLADAPKGQNLAQNTANRRCGIAKQFFRAALRRKLIDENPFADLSSSVRGNSDRLYFISPADAAKVLEACPDAQWRLIFALSRWGGLRCPSEHLALTWDDIDWERGRMRVHSPKTEHHEGGESRLVPIFPELRPHFDAVWEQLEPGTPNTAPIITRYRSSVQNLRTTFLKIIKRAGLEPWPKLFQNLRSTRETELAAERPLHVVCAWIGNSQAIAQKHYLQVTDADFESAVKGALQNPVQQASELACADSQGAEVISPLVSETSDSSRTSGILASAGMGGTGLEPVSLTGSPHSNLRESLKSSAAKSGAVGLDSGLVGTLGNYPDLTRLVAKWPTLSDATHASILSLIDEADKPRGGSHA